VGLGGMLNNSLVTARERLTFVLRAARRSSLASPTCVVC
jgi:hypothetical protein